MLHGSLKSYDKRYNRGYSSALGHLEPVGLLCSNQRHARSRECSRGASGVGFNRFEAGLIGGLIGDGFRSQGVQDLWSNSGSWVGFWVNHKLRELKTLKL